MYIYIVFFNISLFNEDQRAATGDSCFYLWLLWGEKEKYKYVRTHIQKNAQESNFELKTLEQETVWPYKD